MRYLLVTNRRAGSISSDSSDLVDRARRELSGVEVLDLGPSVDLAFAVRGAVEAEAVVVASGGDGTVNAVAQHLVPDGTLAILPGGTLNHFARDLGLGGTDAALQALRAMKAKRVDVGRCNGEIFLNDAAMGLYPEMVRERDPYGSKLGWLVSTATASLRVLRKARPLEGSIAVDGDERRLHAWMLFVGNNRFSTTPGRIGRRERLDEGVMDVRLLRVGRRARHSRSVTLGVLRGRPWNPRRMVSTEGNQVELKIRGEPRPFSLDGEARHPTSEVRISIERRALRVVVPAE